MIDDNPFDVELMRMAIKEIKDWPVQIALAEDGEEAIRLLREHSRGDDEAPDLILLDLNLPKRDGTEVLQAIRAIQRFSRLPVAILSSSPDDVIQQKLTAAGVTADGHFTKPFGYEKFLEFGHVLRDWYEQRVHHAE